MIRISPYSSVNFCKDWRLPFQYPVCYVQKFKPTDVPCVQYFVKDDDVTLSLEVEGETVEITPEVIMEANGGEVLQALINLSAYDGIVGVRLERGGEEVAGACVCVGDHDGTVLIECANNRNDFETVFSTGTTFPFRVEGCFLPGEYSFEAESNLFRDQRYKQKMLSAYPIEKKTLSIGGAGVPNWAGRKLNLMFCATETWVDGKKMVRSEDSIEVTTLATDYPLFIYKIVLEDTSDTTRDSILTEDSVYVLQQNYRTISLENNEIW